MRVTICRAAIVLILLGTAGCTNLKPIGPATAPSGAETAAHPALAPADVSIDTLGLPYSWQANLVAATPYTDDQPPGPTGLPEHIEINFGGVDTANGALDEPILYIIPVDAYRELWNEAGNPQVSAAIDHIYQWTVALQSPPPVAGLPALPMEEIGGVNDLAVQIDRVEPLPDSASRSGFRFVGRWAQDANPVTNQGLRYVYQGFTNDGAWLAAFFYPVATAALTPIDELPAAEWDAFNADPQGYIQAQANALNALAPADWEPDLATLDEVVASLRITGMPATGLFNGPWLWTSTASSGEELAVADPENYQVNYHEDGVLEFLADCNSGSGTFTWTGGMVGGVRTDLGGVTLADCGADSMSKQLFESLRAAQDYRVQPGGRQLRLNMPAGGPVLTFTRSGAAIEP